MNDLDGGRQAKADAFALDVGRFFFIVRDHFLGFCVRTELQKTLRVRTAESSLVPPDHSVTQTYTLRLPWMER